MKGHGLDYVFAPLDAVDAKSLTAVAERLKKSLNKTDRAVGAFLLRYLDYKSGEGKDFSVDEDGTPLADLRDLR
ncbi:MAG: hypothetical protein N2442_02960 [Spirochaetes bacterium]|nr:hypothetical protein [Spirochaetota bacterium]